MLTQREYFSVYPFRFTKDTRSQQTVSLKSCLKINTVCMFLLDESPQFTNCDILEYTSSGFVDCGHITDSFVCVLFTLWMSAKYHRIQGWQTTRLDSCVNVTQVCTWFGLSISCLILHDREHVFECQHSELISDCPVHYCIMSISCACVCAVQEVAVSSKIKSARIDFMSWRHLLLFGWTNVRLKSVGKWELQCPLDLFRVKRGSIVKLRGVCHDSFFVIFFSDLCAYARNFVFRSSTPADVIRSCVEDWSVSRRIRRTIKMDASISINIICSSGWRSGAAQDNWIRAPFISRISDIRQLITTYPWHYRTFILGSKLCVFMILRIRWFCQYTEINVDQVSA